MSYICIKQCTLNGVAYNAGDPIPSGAILPSRVKRLITQGVIARSTNETVAISDETSPLEMQTGQVKFNIYVKTEDGPVMLELSSEDIQKTVDIMQLNADQAVKEIKENKNENILSLISAIDSRKTVIKAILSLQTPGGENDTHVEDDEQDSITSTEADTNKNGLQTSDNIE